MSFNPFINTNGGVGGGNESGTDKVRYRMKKIIENGKTIFQLQESINNGSFNPIKEDISFNANEIIYEGNETIEDKILEVKKELEEINSQYEFASKDEINNLLESIF